MHELLNPKTVDSKMLTGGELLHIADQQRAGIGDQPQNSGGLRLHQINSEVHSEMQQPVLHAFPPLTLSLTV